MFLNANTPDELREALDRCVRSDPGLCAEVDQLEMERKSARRLAPHNRFFFSDSRLRGVLDHAFRSVEDWGDPCEMGIAPVIRCQSYWTTSAAYVVARSDSDPTSSGGVTKRCAVCNQTTGSTVPFWAARGQYIVQIDTCNVCAGALMDRGAIPQLGIPEPYVDDLEEWLR